MVNALLQMTPRFAIADHANARYADTVQSSTLGNGAGRCANLKHLFIRQFMQGMRSSLMTSATQFAEGMFSVIPLRKIFKIHETIVRLVSILVVNCQTILGADEGSHYERVDLKADRLVVPAQAHPPVAIAIRIRLQDSPVCAKPGEARNASKVGHFVKACIVGNWFPSFHISTIQANCATAVPSSGLNS